MADSRLLAELGGDEVADTRLFDGSLVVTCGSCRRRRSFDWRCLEDQKIAASGSAYSEVRVTLWQSESETPHRPAPNPQGSIGRRNSR